MEQKKVKIVWPNGKTSYELINDNWINISKKNGFEIPLGCLEGRCGACEIEVNGKTIRACIETISNYDSEELKVDIHEDPYW